MHKKLKTCTYRQQPPLPLCRRRRLQDCVNGKVFVTGIVSREYFMFEICISAIATDMFSLLIYFPVIILLNELFLPCLNPFR